jgi:hypothetical protein
MQGLAGFIMRGRSQASLVAAATAVLSLLVPLLGLVSAGAVALVTLRQGAVEGLIVGLFAGLASGLFVLAALGSPLPALVLALVMWLPVWLLAVVLRATRSLGLVIQLSGLIGLVIVLGLPLFAGDPVVYWTNTLEPLREGLVEGQVIDEEGSKELVAGLASWMTGAFAAAFFVQVLLSLFLGRWWQALLYNPGGFGAEFRAFRLGKVLGGSAVGLLVVLLVDKDIHWAAELLLVLTPLLLLQGIAVVHGLVHGLGANRGWLIGFYVLLFVAMPHAELLIAGLGLADVWMDVRARLRPRHAGKQD